MGAKKRTKTAEKPLFLCVLFLRKELFFTAAQIIDNTSNMLNLFWRKAGYIREQESWDIIYSEKIGYIKILVQKSGLEDAEWMDTPEELLQTIPGIGIQSALGWSFPQLSAAEAPHGG